MSGSPRTGPVKLAPSADAAPAAPAEPSAKIHPKYAAQTSGGDGSIGEMSPAAPADPAVESTRDVLALYLKSARAAQLYPRHSRIRRDMLDEFAKALATHLDRHGDTVLDVRQLQIRAFGDVVHDEPNRQRSFAFKLFVNGVRSVTLRTGITPVEAEGIVDVLTIAFRPDASGEEIQTAVWERCFEHVAFEIQEDSFSSGESEEFDGFLQELDSDHGSAAAARTAEAGTWDALAALPETANDDAGPVVLGPAETAHVASLVARELGRDLFAEVAEFLIEAFRNGEGESVRQPLEEFIEHVLAAGDVLRAARLLALLRKLANESHDPASARALSEVVERIGRAKIVPALGPLAASLTDADREGFTMLLVAIGEAAVAPLCAMLGTEAHSYAMSALGAIGPRYPAALRPLLSDPRPEVVRAAVSLLVTQATRENVIALLPALRNPDAAVRRDVLKTFLSIGGTQSTDILLSVLDDPVYELRALALDGIGASRDPHAVAPLLARIQNPKFGAASNYEKREVFRAVGRIGTAEATAALARILTTTSFFRREHHDEMRTLAASALALAGNAGARAVLAKHEKDPSDAVRRSVQQALREIERRAAAAPKRVGAQATAEVPADTPKPAAAPESVAAPAPHR